MNPAAPNHLVFTTGAQTVTAGACSAVATVQSQDPNNNVSPVSAATTVSLSAAPAAGFTFYSNSTCTTAVGSVTIAMNASSANLYFRGNGAGSVTVTASAAGLTAATQVETVNPAAPNHLVFATGAQTVTAGACSAVATVQSQDPNNNVSPVSAATTVSLSAAPATGFTFYSNSTCTTAVGSVTIAMNASSANLYFRGTAAGGVTVTASAAGLTAATQVETVNPAAPNHLVFTTGAQTVTAGACSAVATVQSQDSNNNVSPVSAATTVSLSAAPSAGFTFYAGAGCGGGAVTSIVIAASASSANFSFRANLSGSVTVTASATGLTAATQVETANPGPTDHFTWNLISSPQARGIAFAVVVRAFDFYGNATPSFSGTASLSATPAPAAVTCTSSCTGSTTTGAFAVGVWTGSVSVSPAATGVRLTATAGAVTGTSAAFDVQGPSGRSPPIARFTTSPVVIAVNGSVTFDASTSSDYQTPTASLQVSWDFEGQATALPTASPWTAWITTKDESKPKPFSIDIVPIHIALKNFDTRPRRREHVRVYGRAWQGRNVGLGRHGID